MRNAFSTPLRWLLTAMLSATLSPLNAATFTDAAGRVVELPAKVTRAYAAGPPASVAVFAIAPDTLIGWNWGNRGFGRSG